MVYGIRTGEKSFLYLLGGFPFGRYSSLLLYLMLIRTMVHYLCCMGNGKRMNKGLLELEPILKGSYEVMHAYFPKQLKNNFPNGKKEMMKW